MACSRAAVSVGNFARVARMKGRYASIRLGAAARCAPARTVGRARAARRRGARATAARWCPRATSPPCAGAGSAPPGQGLWSWRRRRRHAVAHEAQAQRRGLRRRSAGRSSRWRPWPAWQRGRVPRCAAYRCRQAMSRRGAVVCPCHQWSRGHPRAGNPGASRCVSPHRHARAASRAARRWRQRRERCACAMRPRRERW
jgi:hypothetical protein